MMPGSLLDPRIAVPLPIDPRLVGLPGMREALGQHGGRLLLKASRPRRGLRRMPGPAEIETERPFWGPHPDPEIAFIEDEFWRPGMTFLRQLLGAALGKTAPRTLHKAYSIAPTQIAGWGEVADLFRQDLDPEHRMAGWQAVIDRLVSGLFPGSTQVQIAQGMALRAHLLHRAGERVAGALDVPSWATALRKASDVSRASLQWTKVRGLEYMVDLTEKAKAGMLKQLVASKEAGEGQQQLQRRLYDRFGQMNRDWRRTALTETAAAVSNGALASVDPAERWLAEWVGRPNACPFCKSQIGRRFRVVSPEATQKDGDTQVWVGKSNIGRSAHSRTRDGTDRKPEELWHPCLPAHPCCVCSWSMHRIRR